MGLIEQYSPLINTRTQTTFTKSQDPPVRVASSSVQTMGGAFILLNATLTGIAPARLRLYADEASMHLDANRPTGSFVLSESVALIADLVLRDTNMLTLNPPIIGNTIDGGRVWYHLSGSTAAASVTITSYALTENLDSGENRFSLRVSGSAIPTTGEGVSGSITTSKSFLILTGSATSESRLRLYSRPITEVSSTEKSRTFETQASSDSLLIADLLFDSGGFTYPLVPILEAYTWESNDYLTGTGTAGYILQNRSAGTTDITASLQIFSTED